MKRGIKLADPNGHFIVDAQLGNVGCVNRFDFVLNFVAEPFGRAAQADALTFAVGVEELNFSQSGLFVFVKAGHYFVLGGLNVIVSIGRYSERRSMAASDKPLSPRVNRDILPRSMPVSRQSCSRLCSAFKTACRN